MSHLVHCRWFLTTSLYIGLVGPRKPKSESKIWILFEMWIQNPSLFKKWLLENCFEILIPESRIQPILKFDSGILPFWKFESRIPKLFEIWIQNPLGHPPPLQVPTCANQLWIGTSPIILIFTTRDLQLYIELLINCRHENQTLTWQDRGTNNQQLESC